MGRLNSQKDIFRLNFIIFLAFLFCLKLDATVIPDNTTIVGDVTIQSTNGIDINPGSDTNTDLISIGVTGSPKISWNETEDALQFIEKLIIGTNASLTKTINASSYVSKMALDTDTSTDSGGIDITRHGSSDASYGVINMSRSRGTHASPTIVQSGDLIGSLTGLGYDGVDFEPAASIQMYSDGTPGSNDMPGRIDFKTVADGSRVLNQVMRLGQNTDVMIGTTTSAASSILEVQSVTRGSRPAPRMQQTERDAISSPATGLMVYNTDFNTYNFYNGSGWKDLISTSASQSMSNKTVTDALKFQETGGGTDYIAFQAPSSVASSVTFTLPSTDGSSGQALKTDGAGTLSWGTAGSGSGGVNYIDNPDAETNTTGWATYADAAGTSPVNGTGGSATTTWTRTTSSPLRGTGSFLLTKDAANRQGEGASYDFTIAAADKAKVLQISFSYIVGSGTFTAGTSSTDSDVTVWIYDVTNSRLIQPSTYKFLSNSTSIASLFEATFQTASDSTSYRLILHVGSTSASAYTVKFDDVKVSPSVYVYGTPITDWQSVTPTFTGLGTVTSIEVYSRRVGDSLQMRGNYTTGTTTATEARISLAYGTGTVTSTAIPSIRLAGHIIFSSAAAAIGTVLIEPSVQYVTLGAQNASVAGLTKENGNFFSSSSKFSFFFEVPIVGWSSSVQMSDKTDPTVISMRAYRNSSNQSITTTSATTLIYNAVSFDTLGAYNTSTGEYTVQVPGKYRVHASNYLTNCTAEVFLFYILKNGSVVSQNFFTAATDTMNGIDDVLDLTSGDVIKIQSQSSTDTSYSLVANSSASYFYIERTTGTSTTASTESVNMLATSSTTSLDTSTPTIVNGTKVYDSHGAYNTSTGIYTCPISGRYQISVGLRTNAVVIGVGGIQEIYVKHNSDSNIPLFRSYWSSSTYQIMLNGTYAFNCLAGDTLKSLSYQNATVSLDGSTANFIEIHRIGNY